MHHNFQRRQLPRRRLVIASRRQTAVRHAIHHLIQGNHVPVSFLAQTGYLHLCAHQPLAASLLQMAISRAREFEADRGGAEISGDPRALASALDKIQRYARGIPLEAAEAHPETAQMMIMNPLSAEGIKGLFATHPSTEERIARLMAMARNG